MLPPHFIGCDPLGYLISGIEVPFGLCEYNYIGAILGEPVSVVHGPVTGLPVPAEMQGRSLRPILAGQRPADWRTRPLCPKAGGCAR